VVEHFISKLLLFPTIMSAFDDEEVAQKVSGTDGGEETAEVKSSGSMIDYSTPQQVIYCPTCTMPVEFCEHGACFDKCLPWIFKNCPQVLSDAVLAEMMGEANLDDDAEVQFHLLPPHYYHSNDK